ncbi:MAG: hypothetical protein QM762_08335 [Chryseolinea sp.]
MKRQFWDWACGGLTIALGIAYGNAAGSSLSTWVLDSKRLYQVDSDRAQVQQAFVVSGGVSVSEDVSGNAWVLTQDHLQRWETPTIPPSVPVMRQSVDLGARGITPVQILRTDPTDGSAWLANDTYIWHVGVDGALVGMQLAPESLRDMVIGWDQSLWLLGTKTLRHLESVQAGGRLVDSFSIENLPAVPTRLALDPIHHSAWLGSTKGLSRIDLSAATPRLDLQGSAGYASFLVTPNNGNLWILSAKALTEYKSDGSAVGSISLSAKGITSARQFSADPSGRYLWVVHDHGVTRIDTTTTVAADLKYPDLGPIKAIAAAPFAATPQLALLSPDPFQTVQGGSTLSLQANASCVFGPCNLSADYFTGLDIRASINGVSLGVLSVDPDTRQTSIWLSAQDTQSPKLNFQATATDAFGRQASSIESQWKGTPAAATIPGTFASSQPLTKNVGTNTSVNQSVTTPAPATATNSTTTISAGSNSASSLLSRLPLTFELNQGQHSNAVQYLARGPGYHLFFTQNESVMRLRHRRSQPQPTATSATPRTSTVSANNRSTALTTPADDVLRVSFPGAKLNPKMVPEDLTITKTNYLTDKDKSKWRTNVPNYAKLRRLDVYPNIDQLYYGNGSSIEYDWIVKPGADPGVIREKITGAQKLSINAQGDLVIDLPSGSVTQHRPQIYQQIGGVKKVIDGQFVIQANDQISFSVGAYDVKYELTIDPILA